MKRLIVSAAIISALGLAGCGGDTLEEIQQATPVEKPFVRIVYDPANTAFSLPNDLAMTPPGTFIDMTLNTEGSATFDNGNPQHALTALDGWSTHHAFTMNVALPAGQGLTLDSATIGAPGTVRIFEATPVISPNRTPSAACQATAAVLLAPGMPCEIGDELQFGVDFVTTAVGDDTISVVPLKPFKQGQGYIVAVTDSLKDSAGRSVKGSSSWELVAADIADYPLPLASQTLLQTIVNQMLSLLGTQGVEESGVIYSKYFSVQSVGDTMSALKQSMIAPFATALQTAMGAGQSLEQATATAGAQLPVMMAGNYSAGGMQFDYSLSLLKGVLGVDAATTCDGLIAGANAGVPAAVAGFQSLAPFCAARMKSATITLPYYLSSTDPLNGFWKAACTNGVMLQAMEPSQIEYLIGEGRVGPNNAMCQAVGLYDLVLDTDDENDPINMHDPRYVTKFSPLPVKDSDQVLDVQITVPDATVLSMINGTPTAAPASGWPVVILAHGITSKKEDLLLLASLLASNGYATVAIDQPLHGSRGLNVDGQTINASTGFGGSTTDYMNLSSLLTARDNVRQSSLDALGLRLGLNALVDTTLGSINLDTDNVHFFGHSIGAITGTNTVATANTPMAAPLDSFNSMFAIKSAILANPGGSIAAFLTESESFGNTVKGSVAAGSSAAYQAFLPGFMADNAIADSGVAAVAGFDAFMSSAAAADVAEVQATLSSFVFAATTILDSADPLNTGALLAATNTPVYVNLVSGDGSGLDNHRQDATIPVNLANPVHPLGGGEPMAAVGMGLPHITTTTKGSGYVTFSEGGHSSVATPGSVVNSEMVAQIVSFLKTVDSDPTDPTIVINLEIPDVGNVIDERSMAERKAEIQGQ